MRMGRCFGALVIVTTFGLACGGQPPASVEATTTNPYLEHELPMFMVSFEFGPMNVQVLGDVAMAQASVREKTIRDGKDVSGEFVFMDLLKKRAGQWVVVRTLGAWQ
jgi:ketosteroid isomerase-like protein